MKRRAVDLRFRPMVTPIVAVLLAGCGGNRELGQPAPPPTTPPDLTHALQATDDQPLSAPVPPSDVAADPAVEDPAAVGPAAGDPPAAGPAAAVSAAVDPTAAPPTTGADDAAPASSPPPTP
jgi:hypothetical protein